MLIIELVLSHIPVTLKLWNEQLAADFQLSEQLHNPKYYCVSKLLLL